MHVAFYGLGRMDFIEQRQAQALQIPTNQKGSP